MRAGKLLREQMIAASRPEESAEDHAARAYRISIETQNDTLRDLNDSYDQGKLSKSEYQLWISALEQTNTRLFGQPYPPASIDV